MRGAIAYAALFLIALPVALALWARRLDQILPLPYPQASAAGIAIAAAGLLFMTLATRDLWVHGQGLPASPFPPRRLVTRGIYAAGRRIQPALRPYGYFGAPLAVAVVALFAASAGGDGWLLFAAFGTGSCFTHAVGRLRCLVQGCCHGSPTSVEKGIVYVHPMSRVVRLANLGGVPIHPTPLYSIVWMFLVGFALLRLWSVNAPLQFIAGTYFILVGLGRFVEEQFRGEPQTSVIAGLRLYQWLSIGFIVAGAGLTALASGYGQGIGKVDSTAFFVFVGVALVLYLGFGADFPASSRRFSRLR